MTKRLKAPFPWFGGKSGITDIAWQYLGNVPNYVEPLFGSGANLLNRPHEPGIETVNDIDGMVANFWRAVTYAPGFVARYADWPPNENDLHARHAWLVGQKESMQTYLEGNPEWYDAKIAGWWVWGICCWIGSEFCSGKGPWSVHDGQLMRQENTGQGVHRQKLHLHAGQGVHQKAAAGTENLIAWMQALSDRLRRVRVCCGDWSRVCTPTPTFKQGLTGLFLDPPYGHHTGRTKEIYTHEADIGSEIEEYCLTWGEHPLMRIVLCGYEGEYQKLKDHGWRVHAWKANGGYGSQGEGIARDNAKKERLWISPNCLEVNEAQLSLWGGGE